MFWAVIIKCYERVSGVTSMMILWGRILWRQWCEDCTSSLCLNENSKYKSFYKATKEEMRKIFSDVLPWFGGLDVDKNVIQIRDLMRGWEGVRGEERGSHSNSDGSWSYWFLMLKTWVLRLWGEDEVVNLFIWALKRIWCWTVLKLYNLAISQSYI